MAYIEFRNIRKSYDGENLVLKNLDLQVNEGDLVTLLGHPVAGNQLCCVRLPVLKVSMGGASTSTVRM
jgi:ABC-type phosphate/phosphonate transport system ATPase subunit